MTNDNEINIDIDFKILSEAGLLPKITDAIIQAKYIERQSLISQIEKWVEENRELDVYVDIDSLFDYLNKLKENG